MTGEGTRPCRGFEGGFNGYGEGEAWEREKNKKIGRNGGTETEPDTDDARTGAHPNAVGEGRDIAALWRWVVDVDAGELVSSTRMCAEPSDFPCINPDFTGLPHRFAYTTAGEGTGGGSQGGTVVLYTS